MKHSEYLFMWLILAFAIFFLFYYYFSEIHFIIDILIGLNISTFLMFGIDKMKAQMKSHRIPENLLYIMTFLGGAIGLLVGMYLFRHKTKKLLFQLIIAILILLQLGIIYYFISFS